jgi:hypothetical protein
VAHCDPSSSPSAGRTSILRCVVPFSSLAAFYHQFLDVRMALACARTAPAWRRRDAVLHPDAIRCHVPLASPSAIVFAGGDGTGGSSLRGCDDSFVSPPPRHPLAAGWYRTARPLSVSAIAACVTFAHCSLLVGAAPRVCTARFRPCPPSSSPVETARAARRCPIYLLRVRRSLVFPSPRASLRVIESAASLPASRSWRYVDVEVPGCVLRLRTVTVGARRKNRGGGDTKMRCGGMPAGQLGTASESPSREWVSETDAFRRFGTERQRLAGAERESRIQSAQCMRPRRLGPP